MWTSRDEVIRVSDAAGGPPSDPMETYFKRHPLKCKAALIGGLQSRELKQVGLDFSRRVTHGRVMKIDGTHLFPMEHPLVAAAAVETALLNLIG